MPTPRAGDGEKGGPNQRGSSGDMMLPSAVHTLPTPTSRDWKDGAPCANVPDNGLLGRVIHHLPTPTTTQRGADSKLEERPDAGPNLHNAVASLLPTPAVNDMGAAYTPDQWDAWTERMKAEHNNGNGHGASLNIEAQRLADADGPLLPTPNVNEGGQTSRSGDRISEPLIGGIVKHNLWGKYAAAIARWEAATRPAPEPTTITDGYLRDRAKRLAGKHKKPVGMRGSLKPRRQLAARFSEWMMGVPLDWICGVPGITRNEALKAAGNGVVPQQAAEALRFLLAQPTGREIASAHEPLDLFELLAAES